MTVANPAAPGLGSVFGDLSYGGSSAIGVINRQETERVVIPVPTTITGVRYVVGAAAAGTVKAGLLSADGQTILAQRTAGSAQPGANLLHSVAFDAPITVSAGAYALALIYDTAAATRYNTNKLTLTELATKGGFAIATAALTNALWSIADMETY